MKKIVQHGFTLIELMIVVAIIAILAAIVYPSYQESVRKTKRAEGKAALMRDMQQEERDYSRLNTYTAFTAAVPGSYRGASGDGSVASAAYKMSAAACANSDLINCVQLTATPNFTDDKCNVLTLTSTGVRGATGTAGTDECWK